MGGNFDLAFAKGDLNEMIASAVSDKNSSVLDIGSIHLRIQNPRKKPLFNVVFNNVGLYFASSPTSHPKSRDPHFCGYCEVDNSLRLEIAKKWAVKKLLATLLMLVQVSIMEIEVIKEDSRQNMDSAFEDTSPSDPRPISARLPGLMGPKLDISPANLFRRKCPNASPKSSNENLTEELPPIHVIWQSFRMKLTTNHIQICALADTACTMVISGVRFYSDGLFKMPCADIGKLVLTVESSVSTIAHDLYAVFDPKNSCPYLTNEEHLSLLRNLEVSFKSIPPFSTDPALISSLLKLAKAFLSTPSEAEDASTRAFRSCCAWTLSVCGGYGISGVVNLGLAAYLSHGFEWKGTVSV